MQKSKGDKNAYQPGGFSLSSQPDIKQNKKKRKRTAEKSDELQITFGFVMPTMEVVGKKKR